MKWSAGRGGATQAGAGRGDAATADGDVVGVDWGQHSLLKYLRFAACGLKAEPSRGGAGRGETLKSYSLIGRLEGAR